MYMYVRMYMYRVSNVCNMQSISRQHRSITVAARCVCQANPGRPACRIQSAYRLLTFIRIATVP